MWIRKTDTELESAVRVRAKKKRRWTLIEPLFVFIGVAVLAIASETIKRGTTGQETPLDILIGSFVLIVPAYVVIQTIRSKKKKRNSMDLDQNECAICVCCQETQLFEGSAYRRECGSKIEPISLWQKVEEK